MTAWLQEDVTFEIIAEDTDDPVVTVLFQTPIGTIELMANFKAAGRTLLITGLHVQSDFKNLAGTANIFRLAQTVMERMDYDGLEIEGGVRSTGANPGHRPRPLRFTRRRHSEN